MNRIHELSEQLKSKLAAGEVIERPAYIVKELIDNALDSGAKNIRIDLEKNGLQKIIITDDGCGMSKGDLELCFKRYTTSKISTDEDLQTIRSMGFRGEALASVAAIADVTIKSRESESVSGFELTLHNGILQKMSPKGMPVGTQVKVENIFSLLPVRQKFLRVGTTELRHILDIIVRYALAFPNVRFDVSHEGKNIYLLVHSSQEERLLQLFSKEQVDYLLPFNSDNEYVTVSGFTSKPQLSYKSARHVYLYVNNRYVIDPILLAAIKDVYGTLLEPTSFPHIVLFISMPPHLIDVNVHPRKEQVHFINTEMVIERIQEGIKKALLGANLNFYDQRWLREAAKTEEWQIRDGGTNTYIAKKLKKNLEKSLLQTIPKNQSFFQFHNLYIAVPSENGVLFFDQHAVHERILYEQLENSFKEEIKLKKTYQLTSSIQLKFTQQEKILLQEHNIVLNETGFEYLFHDEEVEFISVPYLFHDQDVSVVIRAVLDELTEKGARISFDYISHKMIAYLACRAAVKAGDCLTSTQCSELIEQLKKTNNPFTCPHGRPTQVEINMSYFNKLFKRK